MPHIHVQLLEGRSDEQKRNAGAAITRAVVEHLGGHAESVWITYEDVKPTDWLSGGKTVAEQMAAKSS